MKHLTYRELVHYLDLYSTDPVVRQLIGFILNGEDSVMSRLIEEGMDPATYEFSEDHEYFSPGEYIEHLRKCRQSAEDDLYLAQRDLDDAQHEVDRLKTRSVMQLLHEVERERTLSREKAYEANVKSERLERENAELKEKINVWKVMET